MYEYLKLGITLVIIIVNNILLTLCQRFTTTQIKKKL